MKMLPFLFYLSIYCLFHTTLSQAPPCGEHQCKPKYTTADTYKCYSQPDTTAWNYDKEHWVNCSALLGPKFKVVRNASFMDLDVAMKETTIPLDYCSMEYYVWEGHCNNCYKSWPGCSCRTDADCTKLNPKYGTCDYRGPYKNWLRDNPELAQIDECHDIIKHFNCRTNVAPYDVDGKANHYAHRSHSRMGSSACRSVCEELWDKCLLWNRSLPTTKKYTSMEGLNCGTPYSNRINDQRYPKSGHGLTGCWHINGSISLPNCTSFMPFDCIKENSVGWHPGCEGCICKPGWGGLDCGRCSTQDRMWSEVYRDPNNTPYMPGTNDTIGINGTVYGAAACASIEGITLPTKEEYDANGISVMDLAQCTELNILRPIPAYVPPIINSSSGGGGGRDGKNGTNSNVTHANATVLNKNATRSAIINHYECNMKSTSGIDLPFVGGVARVAYGIHAAPSCFQPKLGGWSSNDCTINGNFSIHLIKAMEFNDHGAKPIHGYSPNNIQCSLTKCSQGKYEECIKNFIPKDYIEPCIKCHHIKCNCPSNSFLSWTAGNFDPGSCNMDFFYPDIMTGEDATSYIGCSGSDGHCTFCSEKIALTVDMPRCHSSTCSRNVPPHVPTIKPEPVYLLFYFIIVIDLLLIFIAMLNAVPLTWYNNCNCNSNRSNSNSYKMKDLSTINGSSNIREVTHMDQNCNIQHHSLSVLNLNYTASSTIPRKSSNSSKNISSSSNTNGQQHLLQHDSSDSSSASNEPRQCIIENINFSLTTKKGVHAIMGPSGAGKTTLLDCIAGRKYTGTINGTVQIDGQKMTTSKRRKIFGYVMQFDALLPILSVRETLMFAANTRISDQRAIETSSFKQKTNTCCSNILSTIFCCLSSGNARRARFERVEKVIHQLGLANVADHYIGSMDKRGLSGGEKKRVAIGVELVVNPPVLLLDEPTTGLDASNSKSIMNVLSNLVIEHHRIVICTVHQPRSEIFLNLGGVTLLSNTGHVVYSGDAGIGACDYFNMHSGYQCPKNINAADFLLDCIENMR
jgi:ABC-type multidrug transport system ATPase subunit